MSRSSIRAELAHIEARIIQLRTDHMAGRVSSVDLRTELSMIEEKIRNIHADFVQEEGS